MRLLSFLRRLGRAGRRWAWLHLAWLLTRFDRADARKGEEWMFGGSSGLVYGDNAAALHAHVREHHPEIEAYWIIDRDSPDVARARAVGPVLYRKEFSTFVRALRARVHILSHGTHDIPTCSSNLSPAYKVFLGHGLTALKKSRDEILHRDGNRDHIFDLAPVTSEFEQGNAAKQTWSFSPEKLVVSGMARFDSLLRKFREASEPEEPTILYMPTWRDWSPPPGISWRRSSFLTTVRKFLLESGLQDILATRGARKRVPVVLQDGCLDPLPSDLGQDGPPVGAGGCHWNRPIQH